VDGFRYFDLRKDAGKGDRRCDGRLLADFFTGVDVERLKKKRMMYDPSHRTERKIPKVGKKDEAVGSLSKLADNADITNEGSGINMNTERQSSRKHNEKRKPAFQDKEQEGEKEGDDVNACPPPAPDKGIRCAGRKRTSRLLWLHEFFRVYERAHTKKKFPYIYEALQFRVGAQLPDGVVEGMSDAMRREIWVLGVCYIPAKYVRKFSKRVKGYLFHTELNDDDSDQALYGGCPEVVRLDNCLKWHPMSTVSRDIPRIVHADDIKNRRVHVAGRAMHFVCGVLAIEDLHCQEFRVSRLARRYFFMYPEHRFGMELNSASMMW